jgi:hypothetical protein
MGMQFARRHWQRLGLLVALFLAVVFLISRSGAFSDNAFRSASDQGGMTAEAPQTAPALAALPAAASGAGARPATDPNVGGGGTSQGAVASDQPRLLVKTGTLSLVIKDLDDGFGRVGTIAGQYGGNVLQYTATKSGDVRLMDIVIQVDSKQFDQAMKALRDLPGVTERKVDKAESQDVTEEFVDIQSQLTNLNLTEQQLRAILAKATRTEDILAVQREITTVRGQIEKLQGRSNYLQRRSDMSNIAIRLEMPPVAASPANRPGSDRSFTGAITDAWNNSLAVLETVGIAVVSVVVFCWWAFPLLVIGWVAMRYARRARPGATPLAPPPAATSGD